MYSSLYLTAQQCAASFISSTPNLVQNWIPSNTFGGIHTNEYVGIIPTYNAPVPQVNMMDGGSGLRNVLSGLKVNALSWPVGAAQTQTFSPEILFHIGDLGSSDFLACGSNTQLGPGLNIHRLPTCGRNWEYAGGEDAYLASGQKEWVQGLQKNKVLATLKHYALNNQELNRKQNIVQIDEATLMETYIPTFAHAIKGSPGAIMCAYNRVQLDERSDTISYLCGDDYVLDFILREKLGFGGLIMTDWTNNDRVDFENGTSKQNRKFDWEMNWDLALYLTFNSDQQKQTAVQNSLAGMFISGIFEPNINDPVCDNMNPVVNEPNIDRLPQSYQKTIQSKDDRGLAAVVVAESIVLMTNNNNVLPLSPPTNCKTMKILLTGEYLLNGGGSGDSGAFSMPEGTVTGGKTGQNYMRNTLSNVFKAQVEWDYLSTTNNYADYDVIIAFGAQYRSEVFMVADFIGQGDGFYNIDRCNSATARYNTQSTYGNCNYPQFLEKFQTARSSGTKVISVVTHGGGFMAHDYLALVDASLSTYYPGEQFYNGLADVLVGAISPGGKLIHTIPDKETRNGVDYLQSPVSRFNSGLNLNSPSPALYYAQTSTQYYGLVTPAYEYNEETGSQTSTIVYDSETSRYSEGNLVGYKYFEKYNMKPLFQFGFGMNYLTSRALKTTTITMDSSYNVAVKIDIEINKPNTNMIVSEVVQVYIGYESNDDSFNKKRPIKELRGFKKVWSSGQYSIDIDSTKTSWDSASQSYTLPCQKDKVAGTFHVSVGFNSAEIISEKSFPCTI